MIANPPLRRILAACLLPPAAGLPTCGAAAENAGVPQKEPPARPAEPVAAGLPKGQSIADYAVAGISGAPANFAPKFHLDGDFRLTLPPGTYEVVVARAGSPVKRVPAVQVTAGATATVDVPLAEGERK
jgi:hypothetical protein